MQNTKTRWKMFVSVHDNYFELTISKKLRNQ